MKAKALFIQIECNMLNDRNLFQIPHTWR